MIFRKLQHGPKTGSEAKVQEPPKESIEGLSMQITDEAHARIARAAYQLYEQRDRQDGHDLDDWLEAERRVVVPLVGRTGDAWS
ncbi:MAG: DUF2934 domain-containing protein [Nitrospira sp.]|nr:DUF2934 domain-containing protein [Nitrospira sp.]